MYRLCFAIIFVLECECPNGAHTRPRRYIAIRHGRLKCTRCTGECTRTPLRSFRCRIYISAFASPVQQLAIHLCIRIYILFSFFVGNFSHTSVCVCRFISFRFSSSFLYFFSRLLCVVCSTDTSHAETNRNDVHQMTFVWLWIRSGRRRRRPARSDSRTRSLHSNVLMLNFS